MGPATIMAVVQAINGLAQLSLELRTRMQPARAQGDVTDEQWAQLEASWQGTKSAWDAAPGPGEGD